MASDKDFFENDPTLKTILNNDIDKEIEEHDRANEILEKSKFDEDEKRIRNEIKKLKDICNKNLPLLK